MFALLSICLCVSPPVCLSICHPIYPSECMCAIWILTCEWGGYFTLHFLTSSFHTSYSASPLPLLLFLYQFQTLFVLSNLFASLPAFVSLFFLHPLSLHLLPFVLLSPVPSVCLSLPLMTAATHNRAGGLLWQHAYVIKYSRSHFLSCAHNLFI